MRKSLLLPAAVGLALSACTTDSADRDVASASAPLPSMLPVSDVVNAVKCELAETFIAHPELRKIVKESEENDDVAATLDLATAVERSSSTEGGATIPVLGIEVGPSLSGGRTRSQSQTIELGFSYDLTDSAAVPGFCKTLNEKVRIKGDPFVDILEGVAREYARIEAGEPKVKLGSVAYTSEFEVSKEREGGFTVDFLIFSFGHTRSRSETSGQSLTLEFALDLAAAMQIN